MAAREKKPASGRQLGNRKDADSSKTSLTVSTIKKFNSLADAKKDLLKLSEDVASATKKPIPGAYVRRRKNSVSSVAASEPGVPLTSKSLLLGSSKINPRVVAKKSGIGGGKITRTGANASLTNGVTYKSPYGMRSDSTGLRSGKRRDVRLIECGERPLEYSLKKRRITVGPTPSASVPTSANTTPSQTPPGTPVAKIAPNSEPQQPSRPRILVTELPKTQPLISFDSPSQFLRRNSDSAAGGVGGNSGGAEGADGAEVDGPDPVLGRAISSKITALIKRSKATAILQKFSEMRAERKAAEAAATQQQQGKTGSCDKPVDTNSNVCTGNVKAKDDASNKNISPAARGAVTKKTSSEGQKTSNLVEQKPSAKTESKNVPKTPVTAKEVKPQPLKTVSSATNVKTGAPPVNCKQKENAPVFASTMKPISPAKSRSPGTKTVAAGGKSESGKDTDTEGEAGEPSFPPEGRVRPGMPRPDTPRPRFSRSPSEPTKKLAVRRLEVSEGLGVALGGTAVPPGKAGPGTRKRKARQGGSSEGGERAAKRKRLVPTVPTVRGAIGRRRLVRAGPSAVMKRARGRPFVRAATPLPTVRRTPSTSPEKPRSAATAKRLEEASGSKQVPKTGVKPKIDLPDSVSETKSEKLVNGDLSSGKQLLDHLNNTLSKLSEDSKGEVKELKDDPVPEYKLKNLVNDLKDQSNVSLKSSKECDHPCLKDVRKPSKLHPDVCKVKEETAKVKDSSDKGKTLKTKVNAAAKDSCDCKLPCSKEAKYAPDESSLILEKETAFCNKVTDTKDDSKKGCVNSTAEASAATKDVDIVVVKGKDDETVKELEDVVMKEVDVPLVSDMKEDCVNMDVVCDNSSRVEEKETENNSCKDAPMNNNVIESPVKNASSKNVCDSEAVSVCASDTKDSSSTVLPPVKGSESIKKPDITVSTNDEVEIIPSKTAEAEREKSMDCNEGAGLKVPEVKQNLTSEKTSTRPAKCNFDTEVTPSAIKDIGENVRTSKGANLELVPNRTENKVGDKVKTVPKASKISTMPPAVPIGTVRTEDGAGAKVRAVSTESKISNMPPAVPISSTALRIAGGVKAKGTALPASSVPARPANSFAKFAQQCRLQNRTAAKRINRRRSLDPCSKQRLLYKDRLGQMRLHRKRSLSEGARLRLLQKMGKSSAPTLTGRKIADVRADCGDKAPHGNISRVQGDLSVANMCITNYLVAESDRSAVAKKEPVQTAEVVECPSSTLPSEVVERPSSTLPFEVVERLSSTLPSEVVECPSTLPSEVVECPSSTLPSEIVERPSPTLPSELFERPSTLPSEVVERPSSALPSEVVERPSATSATEVVKHPSSVLPSDALPAEPEAECDQVKAIATTDMETSESMNRRVSGDETLISSKDDVVHLEPESVPFEVLEEPMDTFVNADAVTVEDVEACGNITDGITDTENSLTSVEEQLSDLTPTEVEVSNAFSFGKSQQGDVRCTESVTDVTKEVERDSIKEKSIPETESVEPVLLVSAESVEENTAKDASMELPEESAVPDGEIKTDDLFMDIEALSSCGTGELASFGSVTSDATPATEAGTEQDQQLSSDVKCILEEILDRIAKNESAGAASEEDSAAAASDDALALVPRVSEPVQLPEATPEEQAEKVSILWALGLTMRHALPPPPPVPKSAPYTGTLKTVIKVQRTSPEKRRRSLKMVLKQGAVANGSREGEGHDSGEERVQYRICKENELLSGDPTNFGVNNKKLVKNSSHKSFHGGKDEVPTAALGAGSVEGISNGTPVGKDDGAAKTQVDLIIPEKSASFSIHPGRLCSDVCSYCFGKFGSLDTPCHIAQLKTAERQRKVLEIETHLTAESCLCDACYRHVDRKANCPSYKDNRKRYTRTGGGLGSATAICAAQGCDQTASHHVRRKWLLKLKRSIMNKVPVDTDKPQTHYALCSQHFSWVDFYMVCGICNRRLARAHMYALGNAEARELNAALTRDGIPARVSSERFLCKLCRYYASLRAKCRNPSNLTGNQKMFFDSYRKRILQYHDIEVPSGSETEETPQQSKESSGQNAQQSSTGQPKPKRRRTKADSSATKETQEATAKGGDSTANSSTRLDEHDGTLESTAQQGNSAVMMDYSNLATFGNNLTVTPIPPAPSSGRRPSSGVSGGHHAVDEDQPPPVQASFEFHGAGGAPRGGGEWEQCTATMQFTADTKRLFQTLQRPYGSHSSFMRHLLLLEKYWRQGDLVLSPRASHRAATYISSVQHRLRAFDYNPLQNSGRPHHKPLTPSSSTSDPARRAVVPETNSVSVIPMGASGEPEPHILELPLRSPPATATPLAVQGPHIVSRSPTANSGMRKVILDGKAATPTGGYMLSMGRGGVLVPTSVMQVGGRTYLYTPPTVGTPRRVGVTTSATVATTSRPVTSANVPASSPIVPRISSVRSLAPRAWDRTAGPSGNGGSVTTTVSTKSTLPRLSVTVVPKSGTPNTPLPKGSVPGPKPSTIVTPTGIVLSRNLDVTMSPVSPQ